jgi:hypothetical protein
MAEPENTPNPNPQGGGSEGGKQKLLAGKYKTVEDLEDGYKNLEKGFHETRQEISQLREIVETRLPQQDYGQGGEYGRQVADAPVQPQAAQVLTQFYSDPVGTLRAVKDTTKQEILQEQQRERAMAQRVSAWAERNPDVTQYQELMEYWVARTDGRLAPEKRLDEAAKKVRERLVELRGKPREANPNPGDYTPGPSGYRYEGGTGGGTHQDDEPPSAEAALVKHVAERNAGRIKRLGTGGK